MRKHYLGSNAVNNMATEIEAEFNNLSYSGEGRRWNFEKYVTKHVELYNRQKELEAFGYSGMDAQSRVRKFMAGIKTNKLDVVKTNIIADASLQSDFDRVSNLYKDFLTQDKNLNQQKRDAANIATVASGRGERNGQGNGNRNNRKRRRNQNQTHENTSETVQDRYYKDAEYDQLSAEQRTALYRMRQKRKTENGEAGNGNQVANLSALVTAAVATQLSAMNQDQSGPTDEPAPPASNGSIGSNRDHPALRQPTGNNGGRR